MKLPLTAPLRSLDGLKILETAEKLPLTLREVLIGACMFEGASPASLRAGSGQVSALDDKVRRGKMAVRLQQALEDIQITADEASWMKRLLGESPFSALVVLQAAALLDGDEAPIKAPQ